MTFASPFFLKDLKKAVSTKPFKRADWGVFLMNLALYQSNQPAKERSIFLYLDTE